MCYLVLASEEKNEVGGGGGQGPNTLGLRDAKTGCTTGNLRPLMNVLGAARTLSCWVLASEEKKEEGGGWRRGGGVSLFCAIEVIH